jgi:hypothetical protein
MYSETLHYMGRAVGAMGAGFDTVNSIASFYDGDRLQGTLDGLSAGLGITMATNPETIPVALPALGVVKAFKPVSRGMYFQTCMGIPFLAF